MARFHFHLHACGTVYQDEEGLERRPEQVRPEALRAARDVICGEVKQGQLCLGCCIVVENEARQEIMRVPFREAVAVSGL